MSAPYIFGTSRVRLTRQQTRAVRAIAARHECTLYETSGAQTQGYQRWFAGPNLGFPFTRDMAAAVAADLRECGLDDDSLQETRS